MLIMLAFTVCLRVLIHVTSSRVVTSKWHSIRSLGLHFLPFFRGLTNNSCDHWILGVCSSSYVQELHMWPGKVRKSGLSQHWKRMGLLEECSVSTCAAAYCISCTHFMHTTQTQGGGVQSRHSRRDTVLFHVACITSRIAGAFWSFLIRTYWVEVRIGDSWGEKLDTVSWCVCRPICTHTYLYKIMIYMYKMVPYKPTWFHKIQTMY